MLIISHNLPQNYAGSVSIMLYRKKREQYPENATEKFLQKQGKKAI